VGDLITAVQEKIPINFNESSLRSSVRVDISPTVFSQSRLSCEDSRDAP
jgi:hypothetical protein